MLTSHGPILNPSDSYAFRYEAEILMASSNRTLFFYPVGNELYTLAEVGFQFFSP